MLLKELKQNMRINLGKKCKGFFFIVFLLLHLFLFSFVIVVVCFLVLIKSTAISFMVV